MEELQDLPESKYDNLLETIWDICASRRVQEIIVGLTSRPNNRTAQYRGNDYENFAILVTKKKAKIALKIERHLFNSIKNDPHWKSIKRKYNKKRVAGPYRASLGGKSLGAEDNLLGVRRMAAARVRPWRRIRRCLHHCLERACVMRRYDPRHHREQAGSSRQARLRTFCQ